MSARRTHTRRTRLRPEPEKIRRGRVLSVDFSPGFFDLIAAGPARPLAAFRVSDQSPNSNEGARPASRDALDHRNSVQGSPSGCVHDSDG